MEGGFWAEERWNIAIIMIGTGGRETGSETRVRSSYGGGMGRVRKALGIGE